MQTVWLTPPEGLSDSARRLAERLRTMKDDSGLSLAKIGARTHYSRASWERWLNGKRLITEEALTAFAAMVGADAAPLMALLRQALTEHQDLDNRARLEAQAPAAVATPAAAAAAAAAVSRAAAGAAHARSKPARPASGYTGPFTGSRFQLPADTRAFTGRTGELDELAAQVPGGGFGGPVVISAIDGMAGVGKTALAVHSAHRVRENFPDGQLFLDLHGHTTGMEPMPSGDALDWLLRSLGVPPQLIPQDPQARAAFYRNRLDGTRTLIILDNAASTAQVRPLLPGTPGCLVLITSRRHLSGLDDARTLALDVLPDADAVSLLHKVAGPGRIPAGHPSVPELIELCGHLPLAIRITAARLRHRSALHIEDLVAQLRDDSARLGFLQDEDRDLTAIFDLSYGTLPPTEQRLFHALGQIPGPDFDAYAAAGLIGTDHRTAERLLESLLDHNLLIQHTADRYRFHDLVRVYARAEGESDSFAERGAALDRLLDYYEQTARAADRHLARHTRPVPPSAAPAASAAPVLPDRASALAWMRTERDNVQAAITYCAHHAQPLRVLALTSALAAFLHQEGPWPQAAALHRAAATAAAEHGDRLGEANALCDLARVRQLTGEFAVAGELLEQALAGYAEIGERLGEANAHWDTARVRYPVGEYAVAADLLERALKLYRDLGDHLGEANTVFELGRMRYLAGEYPASIALQEQALASYQELGLRHGEASTQNELGRIRLMTGEFTLAAEHLELALPIFRDLGQRLGEADALRALSRVRHQTGDYGVAADLLERALVGYRELGHRHGAAYCLLGLGRVGYSTRDFQAATGHMSLALTAFQDLGDGLGKANVLHELGRVRLATGDFAAAEDQLNQALAIFQEYHDRQGVAETLNSLGALAAVTTGPQAALDLYRQALDLAREVNSRLDEARALDGAARCAASLGDRAAALEDLREAVAIYRLISAGEADEAATFLAALEATPAPAKTHAAERSPM